MSDWLIPVALIVTLVSVAIQLVILSAQLRTFAASLTQLQHTLEMLLKKLHEP